MWRKPVWFDVCLCLRGQISHAHDSVFRSVKLISYQNDKNSLISTAGQCVSVSYVNRTVVDQNCLHLGSQSYVANWHQLADLSPIWCLETCQTWPSLKLRRGLIFYAWWWTRTSTWGCCSTCPRRYILSLVQYVDLYLEALLSVSNTGQLRVIFTCQFQSWYMCCRGGTHCSSPETLWTLQSWCLVTVAERIFDINPGWTLSPGGWPRQWVYWIDRETRREIDRHSRHAP